MSLLAAEQITVPLLPLYFLARYLYAVRPKFRIAEQWWLIGSNAAFGLVLSLGAASAVFGLDWPARQSVRELVYGLVILTFIAQVTWLESRLWTARRTET